MEAILIRAHQSSLKMNCLSGREKNEALRVFAQLIETHRARLIEENQKDLEEQKEILPSGLLQRLNLSESKIEDLLKGLKDLQNQADPIGRRSLHRELDEGLVLDKVSTPIGVIGVIFESRPDAAIQIASLILKSGNVGVLKGGKEAAHTLKSIEKLIARLNKECSFLPADWLNFISTREDVRQMLSYDKYIDLVIPRGSNQLVSSVMAQTNIPVLGHADGICHIYLDKEFDVPQALKIIFDSKAQYPSACNAVETLLIHVDHFDFVLKCLETHHGEIELLRAPSSWSVEYGDLRLAVKKVDHLDEAISHINQYGSHHTDVILTENVGFADRFVAEVDSANVFVNCSTRFSDGFRYGFGAEVGISTSKTHARGPVGLDGLTIYKYILRGRGQCVKDYVGREKRDFTHRDIAESE
ncbi:MAG: glutamate-5-semialdehyde dehydrogenase [Bdellovibrionales bacterium]|nr:glutamate-5-semialdehyde dehydrogenase [Bdellovibrionales bacterium]